MTTVVNYCYIGVKWFVDEGGRLMVMQGDNALLAVGLVTKAASSAGHALANGTKADCIKLEVGDYVYAVRLVDLALSVRSKQHSPHEGLAKAKPGNTKQLASNYARTPHITIVQILMINI
jgi:hypothetical protein